MKTLIVDREPHACARLRKLCEAEPGISEVKVARSGAMAVNMIRGKRPDLLLLDVELEDMTGFDLLQTFEQSDRPMVIMVADHERYAFEAFRSGAIDYLSKPIDAIRFNTAISRVHQRYEVASLHLPRRDAADLPGVANMNSGRPKPRLRLMAENSHRLYFLAAEDVDYIESCGNYVLLHVGNQKYVRRDTLKRLASSLSDLDFAWIRRSTLINLARVAFAEKLGNGALAFTLTSGTRVVSKTRIRLRATRADSAVNEDL
jgi:two-component system, LytTR family, response regulator